MVYVNLLPWRESLRLKAIYFWITIVSVLMSVAIVTFYIVGWVLSNRESQLVYREQMQKVSLSILEKSEVRQQQLSKEINQLTLRYNQLQCRQQQIEQWHLFWSQLSKIIPDKLWLNMLRLKEKRAVFTGFSSTMVAINQLQSVLNQQSLFNLVRCDSIARAKQGELAFTLTADIVEIKCE